VALAVKFNSMGRDEEVLFLTQRFRLFQKRRILKSDVEHLIAFETDEVMMMSTIRKFEILLPILQPDTLEYPGFFQAFQLPIHRRLVYLMTPFLERLFQGQCRKRLVILKKQVKHQTPRLSHPHALLPEDGEDFLFHDFYLEYSTFPY
jgi:hypothetical protein